MKTLIFPVKLCVVVGLFVWIFRQIHWEELAFAWQDLRFAPLFLCFFLVITNRFLITLKWYLLLQKSSVPMNFFALTRVVFISNFLGMILPSSLGVDALRFYHVNKQKQSGIAILSTILADRSLGIVTLAFFSLGAVAFAWDLIPEKRVLIGVALGSLSLLVLFVLLLSDWTYRACLFGLEKTLRLLGRFPEVPKKVALLHDGFQSLFQHPKTLLWVILVNVLGQCCRVFQFHLIFLSLGVSIPFSVQWVCVPIILLLSLIPLSIMGLGIKESGFVYFFNLVSISPAVSLTVSLIGQAILLLSMVPGGLLWLYDSAVSKKSRQDTPLADPARADIRSLPVEE